MPTTVHEKNYIKKQKILNVIFIIISLSIMLFFYLVYKLYTHSSITIYLVLAALCSIPTAQFIIRYSLFWGQKDCSPIVVDDLSKLPSNCYVINNALLTTGKDNCFIDNIVISGEYIICIVDRTKNNSRDIIFILNAILNNDYPIKIIHLQDYKYEALIQYIQSNNTKNTEKLFISIKTHLI